MLWTTGLEGPGESLDSSRSAAQPGAGGCSRSLT